MSQSPSSSRQICPHCGAMKRPRTTDCWLCGAAVRADWPALAPGQAPVALPAPYAAQRRQPPRVKSAGRFQFGLSTLLLIVTLFAVICSIWTIAPGLGAVLAIVTSIGLIGLVSQSIVAAQEGIPLTGAEKFRAFLRPIWIAGLVLAVIAIAIVAAFFVICAPMLSGNWH